MPVSNTACRLQRQSVAVRLPLGQKAPFSTATSRTVCGEDDLRHPKQLGTRSQQSL